MNRTKCLAGRIGILFGAGLLVALTGCVGYVDRPHYGEVYVQPGPYVGGEVVVQDDYVYYPRYEVYYSSNRRQYIYHSGRSWVTRPVPPRVSVDVLFASPSVRLDFHDSPAVHHPTVVRQYPRNWEPRASNPGRGAGNRGNGRGRGNQR